MKFNKGDRIKITGDSILSGFMNIPVATGKVFTVNADGDIIGFRCDQTGAIECYDDGTVTKLGETP